MAIVRAIASGNWSNTAIWNTGALPTSADDVYSNTYTVTIDTSPTVLSISNASATGVTAGGSFVPTNGITLTCTGTGVGSASIGIYNAIIASSLTSGQSFTVIGNIVASGLVYPVINNGGTGTVNIIGSCSGGGNGGGGTASAVNNASTGTVNITGNVLGGGGNGTAIRNMANGTVNVTGNVTSGSGSNAAGISNESAGQVNVTGKCSAASYAGIVNSSTGMVSVVGEINASVTSPGLLSSSVSAAIILTGPFTTSFAGVNPVYAARWFWANSNVTPTYYQIRTANLSVIRPLYTADSVGGNPATTNVRSGTIYGPNNELTGTCAVPPAGSVALGVPVDATTGTAAITEASIRSAVGLSSANLDTQLAPLPRLDTTVSSRLASASYTAPLDASGTRSAIGLATANLDTQLGNIPSNVWAALTSALTTAGTIGKRIVDFLDVAISSRLASSSYTEPLDAAGTRSAVGLSAANLDTQLTPLPNLDTTVSSRLAGASYQAPLDASGTRAAIGLASANLDSQLGEIPTAVENASAVRTELATELNRIDTDISTRSIFDPTIDVVAHVTLVDTTTDLTNPPVVPTPEQIALAVATELDPTLTGIDNDVLTRLAAADYTAPPTALQNAEAVETQLATPLGNMDVAVSTRSIFNPTSDVVSHVTLVDTTTDLTNPPVVPTPEQIALAVATELDSTLTEIDNNVLSRLAEVDYTEPPSPEQNALAIREELTPELNRIANCSTVDTTGQQIQNALSMP